MSENIKPELVMFPGFMGHANDFTGVIEKLNGEVNCRVLTLPQAVNTAQLFEEIVLTWFKPLRATLPRQFYIYGYSMGGRLALPVIEYLLEQEPDAILGVFLESAHPGLLNPDDCYRRLLWDSGWAKAFGFEPLEVVLGRWYQQSVFKGLQASEIEELIAQRKRLNAKNLATQIIQFSLGWQPDYREMLASSGLQITYFSGEQDRKFTAIGQQLAALDGVEHLVADGISHTVHFQNPAWIAQHLLARLSED
ncbi:alpha/beta fold hydrolase [Teredinibacter turnerae]|uniref:alpha/beta fold hydrolase n=1 Tax=Teredinibacter turnerae TaxID=2426 RepID=UPI000374D375|nr:alpha/beta fold hydrolase [Teredinibacter turnerae]